MNVLAAATFFFLAYVVPVYADVPGTLSAGTDFVINCIRAGAAIYIVYLALTANRQGVWGVIGGVAALAAAISARTIAAMIS